MDKMEQTKEAIEAYGAACAEIQSLWEAYREAVELHKSGPGNPTNQ